MQEGILFLWRILVVFENRTFQFNFLTIHHLHQRLTFYREPLRQRAVLDRRQRLVAIVRAQHGGLPVRGRCRGNRLVFQMPYETLGVGRSRIPGAGFDDAIGLDASQQIAETVVSITFCLRTSAICAEQ
ncbi:hypothetical protein D3C87_1459490 [compost metagenome]